MYERSATLFHPEVFVFAQALGDDMFAKVVDHVKCRSHSCIV